MEYQIEVRKEQTRPTLSVRTRTPIAKMRETVGMAYGMIAQHMASLGEQPAGPPFVIYYNMDMNDLDVEIGFPTSKSLKGTDTIKPGTLPAGESATCIYTGPYTGLRDAYDALSRWINAHHLVPTGISIEMYLNDPQTTPPDKLQTQIAYPLKAA
jgi:effector-binding domain-containing protein